MRCGGRLRSMLGRQSTLRMARQASTATQAALLQAARKLSNPRVSSQRVLLKLPPHSRLLLSVLHGCAVWAMEALVLLLFVHVDPSVDVK
jgi:hypothetical protein